MVNHHIDYCYREEANRKQWGLASLSCFKLQDCQFLNRKQLLVNSFSDGNRKAKMHETVALLLQLGHSDSIAVGFGSYSSACCALISKISVKIITFKLETEEILKPKI